jgi:TRAP-type C4-dicarboxylate transport system substrate-binding protein
MKKLVLILLMVVLASALVFSGCPKPAAPEVFELKYASPYLAIEPPTLIGQFFCDYIMEHSEGRIEITSYPGSSLVSAQEHLNLVKTGGADIATILPNQFQDALPIGGGIQAIYNSPIREVVPFINGLAFDNPETAPIFDKNFTQQNVRLITYCSAGQNSICCNFLPAATLADLHGKKIGVLSDMPFLDAIGMSTINTNVQDSYESLSRGVYDSFYIAVAPIELLKLNEVSKAVVLPNLVGITLMQVMNLDVWESLPPDLQQVCRDAATQTADYSIKLNEDMESQTLQSLQEGGIEVNTLSPEEQRIFYQFVYDEWETGFTELCGRTGVSPADRDMIMGYVHDFAFSQ